MTVTEVVIGIDIGTSYTKGIAQTEDGTIVAVYRKPSPQVRADSDHDLWLAAEWWNCVKEVVRGLLYVHSPQKMRIKSICVSAIAPTLIVFDIANPDHAYAILYSSLPVDEEDSSLSQFGHRLTKQRLVILKSIALKERFVNPCITDLVGYMNWRITDRLTINCLSFAELNMTQKDTNYERLSAFNNTTLQIVAASEQIGETTPQSARELNIESGISVCGGCPDTMSSVVGAGLTSSSKRMMYLGTFGSILHLERGVNALLEASSLPSPPFRWLLSIPGLGPEIETLSQQWFGSTTASNRLCVFDQAAMEAPPGADGTLFLVPRWKNKMTTVGGFELIPNKNDEIGDVRRRARAVLEGIAYATLVLSAHSGNHLIASGGGSRSQIWLDIISTVLDVNVHARHMAWEATGTADIAAKMSWESEPAKRDWLIYKSQTNVPREVINNNYNRAMEYYHEQDWF